MWLRGASNEKTATQAAAFVDEMVEAAGIEKAPILMKSGTYRRNRCLKSASRTFASCWNTSPELPGPSSRSDAIRRHALPAPCSDYYRLPTAQAAGAEDDAAQADRLGPVPVRIRRFVSGPETTAKCHG